MFSISYGNAQEKNQENFIQNVQSLNSTVKTLYSIISGEKDVDRNWKLFKFLFKEDAEIILTIKNKNTGDRKYYLSIDDYIKSYGKWLFENGFYAKETERVISTFRHMNNLTSTYAYHYTDNNGIFKGVNSINLINENNRWYISNIKWNQETDELSRLNEYLSAPKD